MSKREILIELLKKSLGERLSKLEKNEKEAEASLKLITTSYDTFSKKISSIVKLREEKVAKEKAEELKKHNANKPQENPKLKKKETITKPSKKPSVNITNITNINKKNIPEKNPEKKTHIAKTKSSANLNMKKPIERVRGKSIGRLPTEVGLGRNTIAINPTTGNNNKKKVSGTKKEKDNTLNDLPQRHTIGGLMTKRPMRTSKSMGKLGNKPSLKKTHENKKKGEEVQKMVNNIKIENKENKVEDVDVFEEIKVEVLPPTLMTCYKEGILEKSILQFLTKKEQFMLFTSNKSLAKLNISILKDTISSYKQTYDVLIGETIDDKIKSLEEKYTQEEMNEPMKNFELSKGAQKAIGLLNEDLYLRIFIRPVQEKTLDEIVIIYRIFSQFLGLEDLAEIKSDKIFWEKFSKYVLDNKGEKLSQFCTESASKFIFNDKNILKIKEMSKDKIEKLKPKYWSAICPTTGFFSFIIKDAVEYTGIVEDKKTQPRRIKANYLYAKSLFEKLDTYVHFLEGLQI